MKACAGEQADFSTVLEEAKEVQALSEEEKNQRAENLQNDLAVAQGELEEEVKRNETWRVENQRRKHNYVPLIFEILQQLAKKNMLQGLQEQAVEAKKKKIEEKKKNKA